MSRKAQLHSAVLNYFDGLASGDFSKIPFAETVRLRAPLAPGGSEAPIEGRDEVRQIWWTPICGAIAKVEVLDVYFNDDLSGVCAAALIEIAGNGVVLRVADRFAVDERGMITEQENHFDPRALTNPS